MPRNPEAMSREAQPFFARKPARYLHAASLGLTQ